MYCNQCGNEIPDGCEFCIACGAPRVHPEPQPLYGGIVQHKSGIYGDFGGLMISGALVFILFLMGSIIMPGMFTSGANLLNVFRQMAVLLPVGFAAALTVRTKGLDLSMPAMALLASAILVRTDSLGAGMAAALVICIGIGAVNAVLIHYLRLPAMIVTLAMVLIVRMITNLLGVGGMRPVELSPGWLWAIVIGAVIVTAAVGLLTTPRTQERFVAHVLPVYMASGVFAVLYVAAMAVRVRAVTPISEPLVHLLFVGLLMGIVRYHKNKALGAVFSIVPLLAFALLTNVLNLAAVNAYAQSLIMYIFVLIWIVIILGRGRAAVTGHSLDDGSTKRAWIALLPLIVILLVYPLFSTILIMAIGQPSALYYLLTGLVAQIALLLVTIGCGVWYALGRPGRQ